jgi:hypothetical protein
MIRPISITPIACYTTHPVTHHPPHRPVGQGVKLLFASALVFTIPMVLAAGREIIEKQVQCGAARRGAVRCVLPVDNSATLYVFTSYTGFWPGPAVRPWQHERARARAPVLPNFLDRT